MNIVYFYMEMTPTKYRRAFDNMLKLKEKYNIHFELTPFRNDKGYAAAAVKYWGKDDLLFIEHDHVPTEAELDSIINCPEPNCTALFQAAPMYAPKHGTRLVVGVRSAISTDFYTRETYLKLKGKQYVDYIALGLTKISKETQVGNLPVVSIRAPFNKVGDGLDDVMMEHLKKELGYYPKFHLHAEIEHLHTIYPKGGWDIIERNPNLA